ncbi:hypothetical protein L7F22_040063 [Adiantum nelumboides]|nr:hypothetical protein [Adiantum nelumboides]
MADKGKDKLPVEESSSSTRRHRRETAAADTQFMASARTARAPRPSMTAEEQEENDLFTAQLMSMMGTFEQLAKNPRMQKLLKTKDYRTGSQAETSQQATSRQRQVTEPVERVPTVVTGPVQHVTQAQDPARNGHRSNEQSTYPTIPMHTSFPGYFRGCTDAASPWRPSICYIFTTQSRLRTQHLSPYMYSIFRVWLTMRRGLIRQAPSCQEEIERQPLVWNDYVRDEHGRELGERTHIDWARWAAGPASSFAMWAESSYVDTEIMAMDLGIRRGIATRMVKLDAAIPNDWQQVLTDKYENDANKYWDLFYKRNSNKFFKDRHYLRKEWGEYFEKVVPPANPKLQGVSSERPVILEIGCGVGNTLFPLLDTYPNIFVHACDFSPRAVNLVKAHKSYKESHVHVFVCDVTTEDLTLWVPAQSVDVATLVFSLSAMSPEKMPQVLQNIKKILKPEGHVLIRDYAFGDLAQERLSAKIQKISQNFYVRGDGTRAYYFTEAGLIDLFKAQGYICKKVRVFEKTVENRAREVTMDRRWIQGVFSLMDEFEREGNMLHLSTLSVCEPTNVRDPKSGSNEVDLSLDAAMFGVPDLEVMPVIINEHVFHIKSISKEFQHSCKATGLMLWESAQVLATLLARNSRAFASRTILELGCGSVGICSMVTAMVAEKVVATDGDSAALVLLADNVKANSLKLAAAEVCIEQLNWGCTEQIEKVKQQMKGQGFDMIIGSDVTYVAQAVPLLFATAKALIAKVMPGKPEPLLLLCHIERHVNEAFILDSALECNFLLEGKWPPDKPGSQILRPSSIITSLFPCGLEEVFLSHSLVRLYVFKPLISAE